MRVSIAAIIALLGATSAAGPAAANAILTEDVCLKLARHEAAGNVAYTPGVTARGGRVRRADARNSAGPEVFPARVDISVLLQDRYAIPANPKLYEGEIPVSRFFVRSDGVVNFAGQQLTTEDQKAVSDMCRRAWGERLD